MAKNAKSKPKPHENLNHNQQSTLRTAHVCISVCTTVIHSTVQNSSANLPSYLPDNHCCSDVVYWRARGNNILKRYFRLVLNDTNGGVVEVGTG